MSMVKLFFTISLGFLFPLFNSVEGGILFEKMEMCPKPDNTDIKWYFGIDNSNGTYSLLSGNITYPEDAGDQYNVISTQEAFIMNKWMTLFRIKEKNICKTLRKYLGQNFVEFQRRANMVVGACPIRKGKYQFKDFIFNINAMKFKLPAGKLRNTVILKKNGKEELCFQIVANLT